MPTQRGKVYRRPLRRRFTPEERGAIRAALRAKGDNPEPSYRKLAEEFGCSAELLTKIHARMQLRSRLGRTRIAPPMLRKQSQRMVASLVLKEAIGRGQLPQEYSTLTKEEFIAHLSFYFRNGPEVDRFGQTRVKEWLAVGQELMNIQGIYRGRDTGEVVRDLDQLDTKELRKLHQEAAEATEVLEQAIQERKAKPWERHDTLTVVEAEAEEVAV